MKHGTEAALAEDSSMEVSELLQALEHLSDEARRMGLSVTANLIGAASDSLEFGNEAMGGFDGAGGRVTTYLDFVTLMMTTYIDQGDEVNSDD